MSRSPARPLVALACLATLLTTVALAGPADAVRPRAYANCTALNKVYKHGVGKVGARDHVAGHSKPVTDFTRSNAVYALNKKSDRDKDGIACEKR
jgi:hypothetical protein